MELLRLFGMTDCFDVVPIWPNDESPVVVRVVLRAQAWRTVVFASSRKRRRVELPDLLCLEAPATDFWTPSRFQVCRRQLVRNPRQ